MNRNRQWIAVEHSLIDLRRRTSLSSHQLLGTLLSMWNLTWWIIDDKTETLRFTKITIAQLSSWDLSLFLPLIWSDRLLLSLMRSFDQTRSAGIHWLSHQHICVYFRYLYPMNDMTTQISCVYINYVCWLRILMDVGIFCSIPQFMLICSANIRHILLEHGNRLSIHVHKHRLVCTQTQRTRCTSRRLGIGLCSNHFTVSRRNPAE